MRIIEATKKEFIQQCDNKEIIVFGVGEQAQIAIMDLQIINQISFICDNNPDKQGKIFSLSGSNHIPIKSPNELLRMESSNYAILITTQYYYEEIMKQLIDMQLSDDIAVYVYCHMNFNMQKNTEEFYEERVAKIGLSWYRKILEYQDVSEEEIVERLHLMSEKMVSIDEDGQHPLVIPGVAIRINSVCNLNCNHCLDLMPYQKKHENFETEEILKEIEVLADAADDIIRMDFTGGETLIHPDIKLLLQKALSYDHIHNVGFATNGTIIPDESVLELCKNPKVMVSISDYGQLESMSKLITLFEKNKIRFQIFSTLRWFDCGGLEYRGKDDKTLRENFLRCSCCGENKCVASGKMYACGHAQNFDYMGKRIAETDYIDLDRADTRVNIREKIRYLYNQDVCSICNYCDMGDEIRKYVPAGIQSRFEKSDFTVVNRKEYVEMLAELKQLKLYHE